MEATIFDHEKHKRILVVNDDGIEAPGLKSLVKELLKKNFDVRVVAPAEEKSAQSHSITIHSLIVVEPFHFESRELESIIAFKVHGTPADCVKIALSKLLNDWKPHLLLAGINRGNNAGMNVIYSGTVACALQGTIKGVPSAALSLDHPVTYPSQQDEWPYDLAAHLAIPLVNTILDQKLPDGVFLNINFPNVLPSQVLGLKITRQGTSRFEEEFLQQESSKGKQVYLVKGRMKIMDTKEDFDTFALRKGWITITPLSWASDVFESEWVSQELHSWPIFNNSEHK